MITDETLMALADGELDPAEAARVREAIGRDPDLAERFASFAETRALLATQAPSGVAAEQPPAHLVEAARKLGASLAGSSSDTVAMSKPRAIAERRGGASVGSLRSSRSGMQGSLIAAGQRFGSLRSLALAASLAILVGGVGGFALRAIQHPVVAVGDLDSFAVTPEVAQLLSRLASGESRLVMDGSSGTTEVAMVATHRMDDGAICREFTVAGKGTSAQQTRVACLRERSWRTQLVVALPPADRFTPASGHETANNFVESLGSKGVLTGDAERRALAEQQ